MALLSRNSKAAIGARDPPKGCVHHSESLFAIRLRRRSVLPWNCMVHIGPWAARGHPYDMKARELHEDTQVGAADPTASRTFEDVMTADLPVFIDVSDKIPQTPLLALRLIRARDTRIATPSNLSKPPPETVHHQGRTSGMSALRSLMTAKRTTFACSEHYRLRPQGDMAAA